MARQLSSSQTHGSVQLPLVTSTRYRVESRLPVDLELPQPRIRLLHKLHNQNNRAKDRHPSVAAGGTPSPKGSCAGYYTNKDLAGIGVS